MKKLQILLIVGLLVAVGSTYRHLHEIEKNGTLVPTPATTISGSAATSSKETGVKSASAAQEFAALVKTEAEAMSQLNDRPEEVQKRLKELADKMRETDVSALQEAALNIALNGDQRFLSVYILGESSLSKAQESLETIASSPIPPMHEARMTNQEEVIRGHAVESLQKPESLKRVLARIDNTFIADRAQRNLHYREGKGTSSPEQQDQEALTQLLKKTSR
jgi:hypothetical protein